AQTIYVDRTKSGNVAFHPAFAGRHSGPLTPDKQGRIRLRIFVDASSVEVFGNDGETVITDLVFPPDDHDRIEFFATGGPSRVASCQVYKLQSVWKKNE
ncbi:MAG: GH32 C-terminal domain-containing protein, partial [Planctomycetes bacterium]|nr:GH32 C-terminal domain-containing protein [Planctomycetota bacterium]